PLGRFLVKRADVGRGLLLLGPRRRQQHYAPREQDRNEFAQAWNPHWFPFKLEPEPTSRRFPRMATMQQPASPACAATAGHSAMPARFWNQPVYARIAAAATS